MSSCHFKGKTRIGTCLRTWSLWSTAVFSSTFTLISFQWVTLTATLTSCSAELQHSLKVCFALLFIVRPSKHADPYLFFNLFFWTAHSAYTWDELAEAIRRSYVGVNQVLVLKKFVNWSESIDPYLNEAAKTDGGCLFSVKFGWF